MKDFLKTIAYGMIGLCACAFLIYIIATVTFVGYLANVVIVILFSYLIGLIVRGAIGD